LLESAFDGCQPVERVEQLHSSLPDLLRPPTCLFGLLDGEPDPVNGDTRLVREFVLKGRRPSLGLGLDHFQDLLHLRRHESSK
jgi:hypothetical protein